MDLLLVPLHRISYTVVYLLRCFSYYPLYPPCEEVNVDYDRWEECARLPVTPHILLLPSDLRYFIKVGKEGFIINGRSPGVADEREPSGQWEGPVAGGRRDLVVNGRGL